MEMKEIMAKVHSLNSEANAQIRIGNVKEAYEKLDEIHTLLNDELDLASPDDEPGADAGNPEKPSEE